MALAPSVILPPKGVILPAKGGVVTAKDVILPAKGGVVTARGGVVTARSVILPAKGGVVTAKGGVATARSVILPAKGGVLTAKGVILTAKGVILPAEGGIVTAKGGILPAKGGVVTAKGVILTAKGGVVTAPRACSGSARGYPSRSTHAQRLTPRIDSGAGGVPNDESRGRPREQQLSAEALRADLDAAYRDHHADVLGYFRRARIPDADAEELTQETFLGYGTYVERCFVEHRGGLLRSFARGRLLNYFDAQRNAPTTVGVPSSGAEWPASGPGVESAAAAWEERQRVRALLSPDLRNIFDLHYLRDLPLTEVAVVLDLAEGTVKSRARALKRELHEVLVRLRQAT